MRLSLALALFLAWPAVSGEESSSPPPPISCITNSICNPNEHCLKGQCIPWLPLQNRCTTDVDCHPQRCGHDGVCYDG